MITIYKTPTCGYCAHTAKYLARKGVQFVLKDVTKDKVPEYKALAEKYGMTVPLVTDGKEAFVGWNLKKLNEMIGV